MAQRWSRSGRSSQSFLEPIEKRIFLSLSVNPAGWTVVSPDANSRVIYVSSSTGSDSNGGLSPAAPVASLAKATALVRDGSPDQLLLKAGDTWNTGFPQWTKSGQDPEHPILIGSYGAGNRPVLLTGDVGSAFSTSGSTPVNNLVITGLQFRSAVRDPASPSYQANAGHDQYSGFRWYAPTTGFTLQDCSFQYYSDNLDIEGVGGGPVSNPSVYRCQSLDSYNTSGGKYRSQGLYAYQVTGLSITQSVFDHDGWLPTSDNVSGAGQIQYDHDIYLTASVTGASIQENIIANASNNGLLARGGGDIENNLFLDNPSAISYGASPGSTSAAGGVHGAMIGNVIEGDVPDGTGNSAGLGITLANMAPGTPTLIADNIFTGDTAQNGTAIVFTATTDTKNPQVDVGINDTVVQDNLFNGWRRGIYLQGNLQPGGSGVAALNNVAIRDNNFQNDGEYLVRYDTPLSNAQIVFGGNNYHRTGGGNLFDLDNSVPDLSRWRSTVEPTATSTPAAYPDGAVTEATYDAAQGGSGTTASFLADEESQSSTNWNPAYLASAVNDYLRAGFGAATAPVAAATAFAVTTSTPVATPGTTSATATAATGPYLFSVSYADTHALDPSGIASGNVAVIGPGNFDQAATLLGVEPSADGKSALATYAITPPDNAWTGANDGQYTILMQPDQVRNTAGVAVPQGAIGNFAVSLPLVLNGTARNDHLSVIARRGQLIVTLNGKQTAYSATDVPELQIFAGAGNDTVGIGPGVPACLIDGGTGNDKLHTANGNDTLQGDDGNDILSATAGRNLLLGGAGNDRLISASSNAADLLDGGDGDDLLHGGRADDVLISGAGSNHVQAGRGDQLLLAAAASTEDPALLDSLLNAWADGQPFATRLATLLPTPPAAGTPFSLANIIFTAELTTPNILTAGPGQDWLLASTAARIVHATATDTVTAV